MRPQHRALIFTISLSASALACADEASEQAQQAQAVKQAADDPWLDALEDEPAEAPLAAAASPTPTADDAAATPAAPDPAANPDALLPDDATASPDAPTADDASAQPSADTPSAAATPQAARSADTPAPSEPAGETAGETAEPGVEAEPSVAPPTVDTPTADTPATVEPEASAPQPAPEPAEPPPITIADFNGSYRFVGGNKQREELVAVIEEAAMGLPGIIRGIGRKRLTKTNPIDASLSIAVSGDKVTTTFASGFNPTATIGGGQVTWTSKKSGDTYRVRIQQKGSKLIQVIGGDDGVKTTVFVLSADRKRLTVHHKITADRLPEPMTYRLSYARN